MMVLRLALGGCVPYVCCGVSGTRANTGEAEVAPTKVPTTVGVRDRILLEVKDQASLSGEFVVRSDGFVYVPTIGNVLVAGMSTQQAARNFEKRLKGILISPRVAVWLLTRAGCRQCCRGSRQPGKLSMTRDRSVLAALSQVGWLTEFAANDRIFVLRRQGEARQSDQEDPFPTQRPDRRRASQCHVELQDQDTLVVQ